MNQKQFRPDEIDRLLAKGIGPQSRLNTDPEAARDFVDEAIGKTFGVYRVLEAAGRGGMARVYRGERVDGQFRQEVAVKLLNFEDVNSEMLARFRQEQEFLARLNHPGIARILDGGVEGRQQYLVMEYVRGELLLDYCDARRLSLRERLELFKQVARAVQHAHTRLIIHRDIKPANVLVNEERQVKLLDFGIAKALEQERASGLTHLVAPLTPRYSTPEQIQGNAISTATDIYQLGLLLYELLTGHPAHELKEDNYSSLQTVVCDVKAPKPSCRVQAEAAQYSDVAVSIAGSRRLSPGMLQRKLQGDLDNIILQCLEKEPERRYGTVQALLDDLDATQRHLPIRASRHHRWYQTTRFCRRNWLAVSLVATTVLALASGALVAVAGKQRAEAAEIEAKAQARTAEEVAAFLTGMIQRANPRITAGRDPTVRDMLHEAAGSIDGLESEPKVQAKLLTFMGAAFFELGATDTAEDFLQQAKFIYETTVPDDPAALSEVYRSLGGVCLEQGRLKPGLEFVGKAKKLLAASGEATALEKWSHETEPPNKLN